MKDDISSYVPLEMTDIANAQVVAIIMARWLRVYIVPQIGISDQNPDFTKSIIKYMVCTFAKNKHTPTLIYSPWRNCTVELVMQRVLAAARAMIGELRMAT